MEPIYLKATYLQRDPLKISCSQNVAELKYSCIEFLLSASFMPGTIRQENIKLFFKGKVSY